MLLDNATNYPNVSRTISGIGNIVFDTDVVLLCDTSLGIVELTLLEIPLNHFSTQYKLYVVDNSNNASINPIKIIAPIGFLIDDQPFIFNSINNSSIIVRISSDFNYNSSNYGTLAVEDEGILIASDVRLIDFTGTGVTATASGNNVTVAVSGGAIAVSDESILLTPSVSSFNFLGTGITATNVGTAVTVTVPQNLIQTLDEGISLTINTQSLNFTGTGVTATAIGNAVTVNVLAVPITTFDEGILKTATTQSFNFVGAGITATNVGNAVTVTVPQNLIQTLDEGLSLTTTTQSLNFVGGGITATNVGNAVTVTVPTASVPIETYDEGILKTATTQSFNFVGAGITATNVGNAVTITSFAVAIETYDEGILKTATTQSFNFVGAGITATNVGNAVTVTVPQNLIQTLDEGISLTTTTQSLNFTGTGVTATAIGNAVTVNVLAVPITTFDEGILKTATTQSFNFVGAGITATNVGNAVTITSFAVAIETYDEGILKTATTQSFNFVGGGITATNVGNAVTVTVPTASVPIETYDEGILKTATTQSFNFVGAGVVATNVGNAVTVTIAGGGGSAIQTLDEGVSLTLTTASYNIVGANIRATNVVNAVTITADPFIVSHTYATLLTAISTNSLIAGQTVFITDAIYTTFFNTILIQVSLEALSTNTISVKGSGTFFNADYQTVGNYSGVAGYMGQTGIYNASTSYTIGKVCIYNNLHYKAIAVSLNNLPTNPAFWVLLAFTGAPALTNGYIQEIDIINYNIQTNNIIYREDIRKNRVYQDKVGSLNKVFALFQFGRNSVNNNNLTNSSFADIVNSTGGFFFNDLDSSGLTGIVANSNENSGNITGNNFKNTLISFRNLGGASIINYNNFFQNSNLTINNSASGTIENNDFGFNGALLLQNTAKFNSNKVYRLIGSNFIGSVGAGSNCENNLFDNCNITSLVTFSMEFNIFINSTFSILNQALAPDYFTNNQIINCPNFNLTTTGNFNNNIIDNTSVNLQIKSGMSFNGNQFKDSNLNLSPVVFSGSYDFLENIITNNSQVIFTNDFSGQFVGNNLNDSTIEYQLDYNGKFNNNVFNRSILTYYDNSNQFVTDNIITATNIVFYPFQNTPITQNDLIDCSIVIQDDTINMLNNNWNNVQFNPYSHAPIIVYNTIINTAQYTYDVNFLFIDVVGGICADGINTITRELDFSDPNIKVAGDLTIPNCFANFYGIYLIVNGTAPAVDRILFLSERYNTTFKFQDSGNYAQFFHSNPLPNITNGIVSTLGNHTYKLKNIITAYTDEITFSKQVGGKLNKVVNYVEVT